MKVLRRTQFGNPILRQPTNRLTKTQILSVETKNLIDNMRYTLMRKQYGIGLAAPQVGHNLAISVIGIKPTPTRPDNPEIELVIINPEIISTIGTKKPLWEGCISFGDTKNFPVAQVPRYKKVRVKYLDEQAQSHEKDFEGIVAHAMQHEIDHLNGVLFVDHITDTTSYMTASEYKKRQLKTA